MRNKKLAIELLHAIRNRLYTGLITSESMGDDRAGDYGRFADGEYCGQADLDRAAMWSLRGAFLLECKGKDYGTTSGISDEFYALNRSFGVVFTSSREISDSTSEKIFGIIDAVLYKVEKEW